MRSHVWGLDHLDATWDRDLDVRRPLVMRLREDDQTWLFDKVNPRIGVAELVFFEQTKFTPDNQLPLTGYNSTLLLSDTGEFVVDTSAGAYLHMEQGTLCWHGETPLWPKLTWGVRYVLLGVGRS
ncbi:hypothetical protein [Candidatus Poriferisocius sp.]|uniref:hypothetical protein n=1 Tax=Candidatus Poriferisocius sp. TaxID=3101276 RepID=UPI003B02983E